MWHSAESLSPLRFHGEYVNPDKVTLAQVAYHARQLEKDEIIRLDSGEAGEGYERSCLVLDGPNSGDAIRRLQLTA
jgi:hypothetical protein